MKRWCLLALLLMFCSSVRPQVNHVVKVFFRYGSIPEIGYEYVEYQETGGLEGGHVSIGIDSLEIGFTNVGRIPLFESKTNIKGIWYWEYLHDFEDKVQDRKYTTFLIPVTDSQYALLKSILMDYIDNPPYDYAFFGMRCAAASYDVLSRIGLFERRPRAVLIASNFYPRLFRRKMFALAKKNGYDVIRIKGRKSRIWERD